MRMLTMIILLLFAALPAGLRAAETVIINPKNPAISLSEDQVKECFLGKKTVWDDGTKVVVVVLKEGTGHDGLMKLLGKSPSQFSTGWKRLVFTGKGAMPEQVDNEDELIAFVAKTPGAVAFIESGKIKDGVKAVTVK